MTGSSNICRDLGQNVEKQCLKIGILKNEILIIGILKNGNLKIGIFIHPSTFIFNLLNHYKK